jgi:hypothetical protein
MKRITCTFLAIALFTAMAIGQTPNSFKYQTIVRDADGEIIVNQEVTIILSILQGGTSGDVVCSETFTPTTNDFGLVNLQIGSVDPTAFAAIDWANGPYFTKVELDGNVMGISELLSVPYALYSERTNLTYEAGDGIQINENIISADINLNTSETGDTLFLVPGNYVFIPGISNANSLLPVVTTNAVTNITSTKAYGGGNVIFYGIPAITETGICWSLNQPPTIADNIVASGVLYGGFICEMIGLEPNTLYFVRAYAVTAGIEYYGETKMFSTTDILPIPTVTTTEVTGITETTALSGGYISNNGGSAVTARGICWNISPSPTTDNFKTSNGTGTGVFTSYMTDLTLNTQYYVRAYATNANGTNYGPELFFKTFATLPTVITTDPVGVTEGSAILGGNVIAQGTTEVTERGICFSTSINPTIYDSKVAVGSGLGIFSTPDARLIPNKTYYVRAYATSTVGTTYGVNKTFTTLDAFYESFETGCLDASCGWSNPSGYWSLVTSNFVEGLYGLYTNTGGSEITFTRTLLSSGFLTFWSINTYYEWSWMIGYTSTAFYIDGIEQTPTSPSYNLVWQKITYPVTAGTHSFTWKSISTGYTYQTWIDYIIMPK